MPETANVPIIMLTARGEEADRIRGLETGADDYVTKPFSPARAGRAGRRGAAPGRGRRWPASSSTYADIEMDLVGHKVKRGGEAVALGPTEFRLLRHFLEHPGRVFSRERLLDSVWGHDSEIELRTVDVHIRRLRKAINARRHGRHHPHRPLGRLRARFRGQPSRRCRPDSSFRDGYKPSSRRLPRVVTPSTGATSRSAPIPGRQNMEDIDEISSIFAVALLFAGAATRPDIP